LSIKTFSPLTALLTTVGTGSLTVRRNVMNDGPSTVCVAKVIHQRLRCGETEYKSPKNNTRTAHKEVHGIVKLAQWRFEMTM